MKPSTLIIGLDGATFDLIMPWVQDGSLPNIKQMIDNGAWGELETVFPPVTGPSWSSFLTGKNPGKHGIYDFLYREDGKYTPTSNSRLTRKASDFWQILNENGLSTGLVNIPMTYPPAQVNGYMITGMMTPVVGPIEEANYTYPESLKYEIKDNVGRYAIHPKVSYRKWQAKEVYDDLVNDLHIKSKTIQYLMAKYPTDFTMFVIGGTDKILHDLYHLLDPHHFRYDKEESRRDKHLILDYYKKVDQELGVLISKFCNDDTLVVIMSDHGQGPAYKWIYLNNWLLRERYLFLKKTPLTLIRRILFSMGFTPVNIYKLLSKFGFSKSKFSFGARDKLITRFLLSWNDIDWSNTKAYSQGRIGQIFINRKGREPQGIVSEQEYSRVKKEIEQKLLEFRDGNGVKVVDRILNRDEIYHGQCKENSADIIFMPHRLEYTTLGISAFISNKIIEPAFENSGDHRMNGIFIIKGRGIKNNHHIKGARIVDAIPNVLFYNNLALDSQMDGVILEDIYEPGFFKSREIRYQEILGKEQERQKREFTKGAYSDREAETVKRTLRDLGYLG